jgi:hypothetical protein
MSNKDELPPSRGDKGFVRGARKGIQDARAILWFIIYGMVLLMFAHLADGQEEKITTCERTKKGLHCIID